MGDFLLARLNRMKLYGDKGPKNFQFILKSKHSDGVVFMVSCDMTVDFS